MADTADTFKFSTFLWLIAGLLIPLWPLSLPLCWFFAYRSYKSGEAARGSITDLHAAAELHKAGVLSEDELAQVKAKALGQR
ncbi:hypothetical protein [Xanthobacter sp.]|uniref:hypothetical protein n=1 Tax=Xanthobacter sp. TaxID=35809 RepID=UPI0025FC80B7|nr:hypothetical protein [Xanthobacter sp.]